MKIFKRIIIVALSVALALAMLCSCGTESVGEETVKATAKPTPESLIAQIRLSGYTYFDKATNLDNFYLNFNKKYPGVEVTVYRDDVGTETYFEAIDAIIESGNLEVLGDVVLLDTARMTKLAQAGKLINLSNYVGDVLDFDTYSKINPNTALLPAAYDACLYDGQLYMSAIEYNHKFVFLNVSMLEENGYSFPKDDWTWDTLSEIAVELKSKGIDTPIAMDYSDYDVWGAFARSNGADIYDNVGTDKSIKDLSLTNPDVVSGLEYLADLVDPAKGLVDCIDASGIDAKDISKYAFIVADHEDITNWKETICDENCDFSWDYIHFPRWNHEDADGIITYSQSIGANVYGFAVIDHGDSDTYNAAFYRACAYLALQANVASAAEAYCLDGEAVPANRVANSKKFWREYPMEGKNSSVFSNFAETADFCATLSCFMPIYSEDEIDINFAIDGYLSGERTMLEGLQTLQDNAIANWNYQ